MIEKLVIAVGATIVVSVLGSVIWVTYWLATQELSLSGPVDLGILVAAGAAFLGFFGGTFVKFALDLVSHWLKGKQDRRTLAKALIAELRYASNDLVDTLDFLKIKVRAGQEHTELPAANDTIELFVPPTLVFETSIQRVGLLGATCSSLTIEVFSEIRSFEHVNDVWGLRERKHHDYIALVHRQIEWRLNRLQPKIDALDKELAKIARVPSQTVEERAQEIA